MMACKGQAKFLEIKKETKDTSMKKVDFNRGSIPAGFALETINSTVFDSKEMLGKYWVIYAYDNSYLKNEKVVEELKSTYLKYSHKFKFLGIISGFAEDDEELEKMISHAAFDFPQINNTVSDSRTEILKDNIDCTPAKIIIDPDGRVMYNGCGAHVKAAIEFRLDSILEKMAGVRY
jgi:hypothetical protein